MKAILLLFFVTIAGIAAKAQNSVAGTIYTENGSPLPYASVNLQAANGVNTGTMSDEQGKFELKSVANGQYKFTITLVGFKAYEKQIDIAGSTDLGQLRLVPDSAILKEVVVTSAPKPLISRKADRYVLNVSQSILATGRSSYELLNYAPGVMTVGNNIAINGNTSTKVMVNGRLLRLSNEQVQNYLANLRAEEVESIEIIPVPGAEFEAEGGGGIINIKLKRKKSGGLTGALGLGATTPKWPSFNTNEQLNYGINGLQLYGSHNYTRSTSYGKFEDSRIFGNQSYHLNSRGDYSSHSNNYRFGAGYDFNSKHFLGIEYSGNFNSSDNTTRSSSLLNNPDRNQHYVINGNFLTESRNKLNSLSLNYNWVLDSLGSSLRFKSDYTWARYNSTGNFESRYEDLNKNFLFDSTYLNAVPIDIDNYDAGLDYTKKWKKSSTLRIGAKYANTETTNDVVYKYKDGDKFVYDPFRSNSFTYKENIFAVYTQYSKDWTKTSIQIGLRGENTSANGISPTTQSSFKRNYFDLFPSAFVKHDLSAKNTLSLSYSRRLNRPTFSILNPFELRLDDYTYVKGNPNLKPQYTHSVQLSYTYDNKYDLTLVTQLVNGPFGQPLSNGGTGSVISEYLWQNMDHNYIYGANLYVPVRVAEWWNMVNNFLVYHNILEYEGGKNARTIFQGKSTQNFTLPKGWQFELSGFYQSRYNMNNLLYVPSYSVDLGMNKGLFKDKLNVRLLATDLFNTSRLDYRSVNSAFILNQRQKYLTQKFSIQLTYGFKTGKKISVKKVEAGNATEKNRM